MDSKNESQKEEVKMRMKTSSVVYGILVVVFMGCFSLMAGCGEILSTDKKQAQQTEQLMAEAQRQVGMAAIVNFQERKQFKMILELRDREDLVCYAYLFNEREGKIGQYLGRCIGFGLPASVQYTNPKRLVRVYSGSGYHSLPQPDPNGLFMPEGLSATWVMLIDKKGNARPVYVEPLIIVSPFPLHNLEQDAGVTGS